MLHYIRNDVLFYFLRMPIIKSTYKPPFHLRNGHLSTVLPSIYRKVEGVHYTRERIATPDDDFLDIDWVKNGNSKLVILFHGLEGNSDRHYVKGVAKHFSENDWDMAAWNARSCSGEMNKQPRLYHHADVEDVETAVNHIIDNNTYDEVVLIGFSMGGAMVLNYLIHKRDELPTALKAAVAISAPVDVGGSARELERMSRSFYRNRFLEKLKAKIKIKAETYPDRININGIDKINSFLEFDGRYTAPLHGFSSTSEFYVKASSKELLHKISIPTLLVIAKNDPFMSASCFPTKEAEMNSNLYLEMPKHGGHVGFPVKDYQHSWMEIRALAFVKKIIKNSAL